MAQYAFLGPFRESVRRALFCLFDQALRTDDGKRIIANALKGLTTSQAGYPLRALTLPELPYADLGSACALDGKPAPVFITARFRSGSTLLWNIFRHLPECTAYYEPLNERRWFDPSVRGNRMDKTHVGVDDYWREYNGLEHLGQWYREDWIDHNLFMDATFWEPNLIAYIQGLIDAAPAAAVLQVNRVDFRLPWLRHNFPKARFIHLYRHPRDQWCSSLLDVASFPRNGTIEDFREHDHFYLLSWARDLSYHFPFLDPDSAQHPYDLFYFIWRLSYLYGQLFCHASFCFETLCDAPSQELPRLLRAAGFDHCDHEPLKRLIVAPKKEKGWRRYADQEWFAERESYCETIMSRYLIGSERSCERLKAAR